MQSERAVWDYNGRSCLARLPCEVDTPARLLVGARHGGFDAPPQALCPCYQHHPTPNFTGGAAGA